MTWATKSPGAWRATTVRRIQEPASIEALGALAQGLAGSGHARFYAGQLEAWQRQLPLLQQVCAELESRLPRATEWPVLLEYEIPRRQRRPDVVILAEDIIFVIELKLGATSFDRAGRWQVEDYALDLRDFHAASQGHPIVPILVATEAPPALADSVAEGALDPPGLARCLTPAELADAIVAEHQRLHRSDLAPLESEAWQGSAYRPTLGIIEAAEAIFAHHSVREISHAYADNLDATVEAIVQAIELAQRERERVVCFVTGVPGSGKTLTGLCAAHDPRLRQAGRPSGVFLSGNGPLVKIVREALARDRARNGASKKDAKREVSTFIQNVHAFIQTYSFQRPTEAPHEQVVIFDEAQRAWDAAQMKKKRGAARSEADLVLEIMERCQSWAVVIALVGNGQEIHTGEAGLAEWGRALAARPACWRVLASPEVLNQGAGGPHRLFPGDTPPAMSAQPETRLHLTVNVRSPRAQRLSDWVDHLLAFRSHEARAVAQSLGSFPLALTRDLEQARAWLRDRSRGDRRCGLLASSGARRLRAYGLELSSSFRQGYPYDEWFLAGPEDLRSSYALEVAASQFECQGLEIDWVGLCWGGDLAVDASQRTWVYRKFTGNAWRAVRAAADQAYLLNRYRVLLTRAREGLIVWVPPGRARDRTLDPKPLDATAAYLMAAGVPLLPGGSAAASSPYFGPPLVGSDDR